MDLNIIRTYENSFIFGTNSIAFFIYFYYFENKASYFYMLILSKENEGEEVCSIAWFRLQEAAYKNEHERAFLNYRLLMYSYEDNSYKKEVKAFLHYFFNEVNEAEALLRDVFYEYLQKKEYMKAISIYEFISFLHCSKDIDKSFLNSNLFPNIKYPMLFKEIIN